MPFSPGDSTRSGFRLWDVREFHTKVLVKQHGNC